MKKSLLAVAVAAALPGVALAQSSVTLSGIAKTGLASQKLSNGATGDGSQLAWTDGSSRFIISGVEDIGGGLKGIFQIDTRYRNDNGTGGTPGGNTWVGLSGGFGAIKFGNIDTVYFQGTDQYAARSTALTAWNVGILSYINQVALARTTRSQNTIRYETPNFSGLTAALSYSTNPDGAEVLTNGTKGNMFAAEVNYAAGPLSAGLALWNQKKPGGSGATNATADQSEVRVFGGYNLGFMTVGLTYDASTLKPTTGDVKRNAISVPVTAPIGGGTLLFTYSVAQDLKVGGTKVTDSGARLITLGYDYPLSKRTSVGASYAVMDNKANASYALFTGNALHDIPAPVAGQDTKQLYFGVRHAF